MDVRYSNNPYEEEYYDEDGYDNNDTPSGK